MGNKKYYVGTEVHRRGKARKHNTKQTSSPSHLQSEKRSDQTNNRSVHLLGVEGTIPEYGVNRAINKSFPIDSKLSPGQLRRLRKMEKKRRMMVNSTPHTPRAGGQKINVDRTIPRANLSFSNQSLTSSNHQLMRQITSINHDIVDLWPQLEQEITSNPMTNNKFRGVQSEKKLWKKFLFCYAKYFGNISKACDFCGISRGHFYRGCERYPTLAVLTKTIEDRFIDEVEETTKKHSLLPNSIVERIFLLKVKRKEIYGQDDNHKDVSVEVKFNNLNMMRDYNSSPTLKEVKDGNQTSGGQLPASTPTTEVSPE